MCRDGVSVMGFFSGLEGGLEKYIEGFFRGKFKGRVQPLDIARKLSREMRDRKRVSINLVYTPNIYEVYLSPEDWASISYLAEALAGELEDYLRQKAAEKKFTFMSAPQVNFSEDNEVKPGQIRVSGKFGKTEGSNKIIIEDQTEGNEFEDTLSYRPSRDTAPIPAVGHTPGYYLEMLEGPFAGKKIRLEGYPVIIGRRESCDIILSDKSVSRRHARLEPEKGGWLLTDLDSANGTYVNGLRMKNSMLSPGDTVKFGTILCVFKVD